jgi:hypothetical protein
MFVGIIFRYSRLFFNIGSATKINCAKGSLYSLLITLRFLVCDTFGQSPETNMSDKTKPNSGFSSVPKTFSLILLISILGESA